MTINSHTLYRMRLNFQIEFSRSRWEEKVAPGKKFINQAPKAISSEKKNFSSIIKQVKKPRKIETILSENSFRLRFLPSNDRFLGTRDRCFTIIAHVLNKKREVRYVSIVNLSATHSKS